MLLIFAALLNLSGKCPWGRDEDVLAWESYTSTVRNLWACLKIGKGGEVRLCSARHSFLEDTA